MSIERTTAPDPYDHLPVFPALTVTSTSFSDGGDLAETYVYDGWGVNGQNVSPQLSWSGAPETTTSYVVTCFDPDAPTASGFWHWSAFNIPADVTELPAGAGAKDDLGVGAVVLTGDSGVKGYYGANPPAGHGPHRYLFAVHAVDTELPADEIANPTQLGFNLNFHSLGRAIIWGWYENQ